MKRFNCLGEFAKYSSLNVMGMIGLSCYILADTFFVAKGLGANGLAALNIAVPVYSFIHGSGLMIGMGAATKYSIQKSQGKTEEANRIFTNAVYLAAIFACFFVAVGLFCSDMIVRLLGAEDEIFAMTSTYSQTLLLFSPAFLANNLIICFVRNDGAPHLAMAGMIGGSLSNVVLDYVFIFPCGMGMFGAVFATGLAPFISMGILSMHFIGRRNSFGFAKCKPSGRISGGIFSSGLPSLITELSSGIVMIIFNNIILSLEGNTGVAAYGVISNISFVVISIFTGIAQGIQPIISRSYGKGNGADVNSILKYALTTMLVLSGLIYTGVFLGAEPIVSVFNSENNETLQAIAEYGMKFYFAACPFVGFNIIMAIFFTSTEHSRPAHIISLLRGFILIIPMAFVLSNLAGMTGVWCAFPATELAVAGIGVVFYALGKSKSRRTAVQKN